MFNDAQLDRLMELAQKQSPALDVVDARYAIARAQVEAARANAGPQINALGAASRSRFSINPSPSGAGAPNAGSVAQGISLPEWTTSGIAAADFMYEFDWWGKNRAAIEAAVDSAHAAEVERSAAVWIIQYGVASVYFDWLALHKRAVQADAAVAIAEQQVHIATLRTQRGVDPPQTLEQAKQSLAAARQQREQLRGVIETDVAEIGALLGGSSDDLPPLTPQPLPDADTRVPSDARTTLLARRPDIVASRWMVESAARDVDEARAEFYPDVSISILAALLHSDPTPGSASTIRFGSVGLSAYLPLFDSGRLQARFDISRAQWDSAIATYNASVVSAAEDVVHQAATLRSSLNQRTQQQLQVDAATSAFEQSTARVRNGVDDPRVALSSESQLVQQRDALVELDGRVLAANLSLIRALGGGYRTDAPTTAPAGPLHPDKETPP